MLPLHMCYPLNVTKWQNGKVAKRAKFIFINYSSL